jgi:hypothetical protein
MTQCQKPCRAIRHSDFAIFGHLDLGIRHSGKGISIRRPAALTKEIRLPFCFVVFKPGGGGIVTPEASDIQQFVDLCKN